MDPSYYMIGIGIPTFLALQFIAAPYGKFAPSNQSTDQSTNQSTKRSIWGPPIPARLAWFIQETPSLVVSLGTFLLTADKDKLQSIGNRLCLAMFLFHYVFRAWINPLINQSAKDTSMPAVVCLLSFVFCVWNGWLQGYAIGHSIEPFDIDELSIGRLIGGLMFFVGWSCNQYSDWILRNLRKNNKQAINTSTKQSTKQTTNQSTDQSTNHSTNEQRYFIPYGGLFNYVTSANYFCEFMEWVGWSLMCQSLASWSFALYTAANLFPRARHTHQWYLQKFDDYPKDRKIVIPFVW